MKNRNQTKELEVQKIHAEGKKLHVHNETLIWTAANKTTNAHCLKAVTTDKVHMQTSHECYAKQYKNYERPTKHEN